MTETDDLALDVWLDGDCSLCRRSKTWCEERDQDRKLRFHDFRSAPDHVLPMPRSLLEASMWVCRSDGLRREGFDAWREILSRLPRWRWFAALARLPPAAWIGPPLYRLVARIRFRIPGG